MPTQIPLLPPSALATLSLLGLARRLVNYLIYSAFWLMARGEFRLRAEFLPALTEFLPALRENSGRTGRIRSQRSQARIARTPR